MELIRQKNAQTVLIFPMVNTSGTQVVAAAGLTAKRTSWSDTTAPAALANLTSATPVEVSSVGIYYVTVTATEMNADYVYIYVTTTSTGAIAQNLLIRTKPYHSVTTVDWSNLANATATIALTNTTVNSVTSVNTVGQVSTVLKDVAIDWNRVVNPTATVSLTNTTVNSVTNVSTITSIAKGAAVDWSRITNPTATVSFTNTTINSATVVNTVGQVSTVLKDVAIDWNRIVNPTATVSLTGTTINSVTNVSTISSVIIGVGIDWSKVTNPTSTVNLSATTIQSVSQGAGGSSSDPWNTALPAAYATGTAGSIMGNHLDQKISSRLAPVTAGYPIALTSLGAIVVDWNQITNPTATVVLSGTTVNSVTSTNTAGNVTSVSKPVAIDWNRIDNPTTTVSFTGTTVNSVTAHGGFPYSSLGVGIDWGKMGNPGNVTNLSGTTIATVTETVTADRTQVVQNVTDKTGYAIGVGGIGATSFAAGAIDSAAIAAGAIVSTTAVAGFYNQAADLLIGRNIKGASSTGRRIFEALATLRNRSAIVGTTLTVYDADDVSTMWQVTITTTTAVSISDMDPT